MAIEPAAISASRAVTTRRVALALAVTAPDMPAAKAKGTVRPSAMPMTTSRTLALAVKCDSTCGVAGINSPGFQNLRRRVYHAPCDGQGCTPPRAAPDDVTYRFKPLA